MKGRRQKHTHAHKILFVFGAVPPDVVIRLAAIIFSLFFGSFSVKFTFAPGAGRPIVFAASENNRKRSGQLIYVSFNFSRELKLFKENGSTDL